MLFKVYLTKDPKRYIEMEEFMELAPDEDPSLVLEDYLPILISDIEELRHHLVRYVLEKSVRVIAVIDTYTSDVFVYKLYADQEFFENYHLSLLEETYEHKLNHIYYRTKWKRVRYHPYSFFVI